MPTYDLDHFADITESLDELEPEIVKPSARDVVFAAYDKIEELVGRGVSYRKILSKYQAGGLELSMSTFRQYLLDAKNARIDAKKQAIVAKARATREANKIMATRVEGEPGGGDPSDPPPADPADESIKPAESIVGRYKRVPVGSVPPPVPVVNAEIVEED